MKSGSVHKEKQLAADLITFMQEENVSKLFADHQKALIKYFRFYCK